MARVQVVGAQGAVARAAVARLEAIGHEVTTEGDGTRGGTVVVLDLDGPDGRRERWDRALAAGLDVVSASLDPSDVLWARAAVAMPSAAGRTLLPCSGMSSVLADVLAAKAAQAAVRPAEIHTAHLVAEHGGVLRVATSGLRRELANLVGVPTTSREAGAWTEGLPGEERRLAWFARPVGPHHAAMVPAVEVVTIPEHVPTALTVRGHLAMSTWRAELLQGLGNLAARPAVAARLRSRLLRRATSPVPEARWAIVAEAKGEAGVARAWANGRNLVETTAAVLCAVVDRVAQGGAPRGVPAPAVLLDPERLLDHLAGEVDLRWSVIRPDPEALLP